MNLFIKNHFIDQINNLVSNLEEWIESIKPELEERMIIQHKNSDLAERIEAAHREWLEAEDYFNNVSDPQLVDHATYLINAARAKYMYLLNKAKNNIH